MAGQPFSTRLVHQGHLVAPAHTTQLFRTRMVCKRGHPLNPGPTPFAELSRSFRTDPPAFSKLANRLCRLMSKCILSHRQRLLFSHTACSKRRLNKYRGPSFRKKAFASFRDTGFSFCGFHLGNRLNKDHCGGFGRCSSPVWKVLFGSNPVMGQKPVAPVNIPIPTKID